jgi:hypothetical protein
VTTHADAVARVNTVRRYLRYLAEMTAAVESLSVENLGGPLALVSGTALLLSERALSAYSSVREVRGLAALTVPFPDDTLLRSLMDAIEPLGGDGS